MRRYAIVVETAHLNDSAHGPEFPGCVAIGETIEATERLLREAIKIHVEGLAEDGLPIPEASSVVDDLEILA